ncbi:MAG: YceI family protein [Bdellovibrionota bacterium]
MKLLSLSLFSLFIAPHVHAASVQNYVLVSGEVSYLAEHSFHETHGVSKSVKGKGTCKEHVCEFLVAVPVKSFDSQNGNRDAHMVEVTKGAEFPLVTVRLNVTTEPRPQAADLKPTVTFAGITGPMKIETIEVKESPESISVKTSGSFRLKDFSIPAPSLLGVAVKDVVRIDTDLVWKLEGGK